MQVQHVREGLGNKGQRGRGLEAQCAVGALGCGV